VEQYVRRTRNPVVVALLILALVSVGCESAASRYEKHITSGREQLTSGRLQEAILSFKSALAARPGDFDARKLLAESYLERGAKEPAQELIEVLSKEYPDDPEIPLLDVRLALLEEDADRALEVLQGYMEVHGEVPAALVLVGHAHAAKKLWSEALQAYELALGKDAADAQAWLGKAAVLAQLKRNDEAMAAAARAAELDPHLGQAHLIVADMARAAGDLDAARAAYQRALENDQRVMLAARYRLGQVLFAQNDAKGGLAQGEALVTDYPSRPEGYSLRGIAHYLLSEYDDAVTDLQTCLSKAPEHPGAQFYLALAQYQRKQWEQALGAAKALQGRFPGVKPVEMLIAELLLRTGDYKEAIKQAQRVLDVSPDSALMYRVLGLARIQEGDTEGGAEALEQAQRLAPNERLEFALGDLYLSMDKLDKASANFEAIAAANPESRAAYVRLFFTRLRQKDLDGALGLVDTLQEQAPDDPQWLNLRGAALFAKQDVTGAEAAWQRVVATSPQLPAAHLNLAGLYRIQKKWPEARKEYEQVLAIRPHHPVACWELSLLDVQDGDIPGAIAHLQRSMDGQPDATVALQLSAMHLRLGQVAEAQEAARTATQLRPDLAMAWLQLGVTTVALGDLAGGEASLRKASDLAPDSAAAWYHLGGLEATKKNWALAREHLEKAAALAPGDSSVVTRLVRVDVAGGDPKAAANVAGTFLRKHPELLAAYQIQSGLEEVLGRPEDARRTLALGLEKLGGDVGIVLLQAEFERRQGNLEKATELYQRVIELEPKAVAAMVRKAGAEMASGHFEEAAASYQAALGMVPGQPLALNNLAYLYTDVLQRPGDALALLKRVDRKVLASSPSIRDTLGWAQLKVGDAAAAVATLAKVVEELPEVGTVRYHYGAALLAAGREPEGRRELDAAIAMKLSSAEAAAARKLLGTEEK